MIIFDRYEQNKGKYRISPALLWEYDLQRFDLYGGIEDFRGILREVATLPERDMNFVCKVFDLKKEELRCYTRRQLLLQLWDY